MILFFFASIGSLAVRNGTICKKRLFCKKCVFFVTANFARANLTATRGIKCSGKVNRAAAPNESGTGQTEERIAQLRLRKTEKWQEAAPRMSTISGGREEWCAEKCGNYNKI